MAAKLVKTGTRGIYRRHSTDCERVGRCGCPYVVVYRGKARTFLRLVEAREGKAAMEREAQLKRGHAAGLHRDEPREGCPDCEREQSKAPVDVRTARGDRGPAFGAIAFRVRDLSLNGEEPSVKIRRRIRRRRGPLSPHPAMHAPAMSSITIAAVQRTLCLSSIQRRCGKRRHSDEDQCQRPADDARGRGPSGLKSRDLCGNADNEREQPNPADVAESAYMPAGRHEDERYRYDEQVEIPSEVLNPARVRDMSERGNCGATSTMGDRRGRESSMQRERARWEFMVRGRVCASCAGHVAFEADWASQKAVWRSGCHARAFGDRQ
jgi:hypothetical protein